MNLVEPNLVGSKGGPRHPTTFKVLLVEDNPDDVMFIKELLHWEKEGFALRKVHNLKDAFNHLKSEQFDLILFDLSLPDTKGIDTVRELLAKASGVPMVVLSDLEDQGLDLEVIKAGAQDYLVKGQVNDYWMIRSIRHSLERKRAEKKLKTTQLALKERVQQFNELVEHLDSVLWIVDGTGQKVLYVSPAYEKIWGRSVRNLYANPTEWLDAIYPEDRQRVLNSFFGGVAQGKFSEEYRIVKPDGNLRWIQDRGYPVYDRKGKVSQMVGIAEDLTEKKSWEGAIQTIQGVLDGWGTSPIPSMSQGVLSRIFQSPIPGQNCKNYELTTQQARILALVAEGKTNKEIASEMHLSDRTVRNHLAVVFEKLQVTRRSQAAAHFVRTQPA